MGYGNMEKLELDYNNDNEILKIIIDIILKRHPIVNDRVDILFEYPRTSMDIIFRFYEVEDKQYTRIYFTDGTDITKYSIPEQLIINNLVSTKMLCNLIYYILNDHDHIKNISIQDNFISLSFDVNMNDDNMNGISCGDINLRLDFCCINDSRLLINDYLTNIISNFYDKLKHVKSFNEQYNKYRSLLQDNIINSMSDEELHDFINLLDNYDLCNMLLGISNEHFFELYDDFKKQKIKNKLISSTYN